MYRLIRLTRRKFMVMSGLTAVGLFSPASDGVERTVAADSTDKPRTALQGQRTLSCCTGECLHEEVVIPSAAAAFHDQTVFARMLFE